MKKTKISFVANISKMEETKTATIAESGTITENNNLPAETVFSAPEIVENIPAIIEETPKTIPAPPTPEQKVKKTEYEKLKERGVLASTLRFQGEEAEHLKKIINARIESGITENETHFFKQCVDFAINYNSVFNKPIFGLPPGTPQLLLKKGYFNK